MITQDKEENAYSIEECETHTLITLNVPRLDAVLSPRLKSEFIILFGLGQRNILLDLAACSYCDSSGLSALLVGNRLCKNAGGIFILRNLSAQIERLIAISHLETVLSIAYSDEQVQELLE
ncbi:MAG: STAS domain-containing protein [Bacteroides sp.]